MIPEDSQPAQEPAALRRPNIIELVNQCARWTAIRAILLRPYLLIVPMHRIRGTARQVFWIMIDGKYSRADVEQKAAEWLHRRSNIPRWMVLLLRWALRVIIRLVSKWFENNHPERYV